MDQLKDVILSTLAEIQENSPSEESAQNTAQKHSKPLEKTKQERPAETKKESFFEDVTSKNASVSKGDESELLFLNSLRERMLVLFEGFQAPNNSALEAKIDLTLNFLEYVLASIDARIEQIKGK